MDKIDYREIAKSHIERHEGRRRLPYKDSRGILTIGIGRNLLKGLSDDEIDHLFMNDLLEAEVAARKLVYVFDQLSENRKAVILNLAFNLGETRLRGFKKALEAINSFNYEEAAKELENSLWYSQVGYRSKELIRIWRGG